MGPHAPPSGLIIGIYESEKGNPVVITSDGLFLVNNGSWIFIKYSKIQEPDTPIGKTDVRGFYLVLTDGTKVWLPISGVKNDRFYDAFEFIRFIDRVIKDKCNYGKD